MAESLDTELVSMEDPAMVMESEPDALHMDTSIPEVPTPAIAAAAQAPEAQEGRVDTTIIPEAESDLPSHEVKTEGSSLFEEGDAVQDSSPSSKDFVDIEIQPEVKADSGDVAVNILPETLPSTVTSSFFDK